MLLFQGTMDPLVPHTQAYRMADAMTRAGVDGRVELLIGLGHGWVGPELRRTAEAAFTFFDNRLSNGKPPSAATTPPRTGRRRPSELWCRLSSLHETSHAGWKARTKQFAGLESLHHKVD